MLQDIFFMLLGLALLTGGAEVMITGASKLAERFGISPLVVGLTVVALGTSAPELAVSLSASFSGRGSIAVGNVIGSNISNIALVLGLSALIYPLSIQRRLLRLEVPLLFVVSLVLYGMALTGQLPRLFGLFSLLGLGAYLAWVYWLAIQDKPESHDDAALAAKSNSSLGPDLLRVFVGLLCLTGGGKLLVDGAIGVARIAGLSELTIGLTIVAVGTSMPELVTSIMAVLKKQTDIAIGNVLGSNLFNTLGVLGATATVSPVTIEREMLVRDFPAMILLTALLFPLLKRGFDLKRWEGALLLVVYIAYTTFLFVA